jgi:NitT/TauT family transport system substrate-binding protein
MSISRRIIVVAVIWIAAITLTHLWLNTDVPRRIAAWWRGEPSRSSQFKVGFLPVTCHLTCPVNHYITRQMNGDGGFEPVRFSAFPELKESFLAGHLDATFILAPLAMSLREQGIPIKIVYLGHRDGSALMVHKDSGIYKFEDLRGKTIAVPNRYSNQRLIIYRALRNRGMTIKDVKLIEMPPPDMPAALSVRAVDGIISGEPFMGQTELDGYGRTLFQVKDEWPNFISCVLAVKDETIANRRPEVQKLVNGIAASGKWLEVGQEHRMEAAEFTSKYYYNQNPRLLRFVLSKPPDRVKYTNLSLHRKDFEEIQALGVESGILKGTANFEDYCDPSFVTDEAAIRPHPWEPKK